MQAIAIWLNSEVLESLGEAKFCMFVQTITFEERQACHVLVLNGLSIWGVQLLWPVCCARATARFSRLTSVLRGCEITVPELQRVCG